MRIIRSYWLEIVFSLLIFAVICLSVKNVFKVATIDYGKHLEQTENGFATEKLADYLGLINENKECTAIIVVKDIQGYYLTQEDIEALKDLGFDQSDILLEKQYHSFIGIWSEGNIIYQCVGGDEAIEYGQYFNDHYIYTKSATFDTGNVGDIYIDDIQYSVNNRGFNIVVINGDTLVDSISYDVYDERVPMYRIIDGNLSKIDS